MTHIYKLLLAMLLCIVPASQMYSVLIDGLCYNIDETSKTATVTYKSSSLTAYSGDLVIPSAVEYNDISYQVTSIGEGAFSGCSGLTSITIPESVTSIGYDAFYNCSNLTKAEFSSIESLCNIKFNSGISNPLYYAHHLFINGEEVTDLVIPASVTSIGSCAFSHCSSLTSVTIPASVTSIGSYAFYDCSSLTSVTIPESVTSIGSYAFRYCSSLTSITILASVTSIGSNAFEDCSNLTKAEFSSIESLCNITFNGIYSNPLYYAHHLFINGEEVTDLVIPASVTSIGPYAFRYCSSLTSITIPASVTSIGYEAFRDCSNLFDVTINSEALISAERNPSTSLASVFGTQVKEYVLCNKVTSLGSYVFSGCSGLTSITIQSGVISIGNGAFSGCSGLTSITIPESVTSIGYEAFYNCSNLTKAEFSSIESLCNIKFNSFTSNPLYYAHHLFINGEKVTDLVIPASVTSIGVGAFYGCSSLTSVTIPESVTSIGSYAFYGCSGLTSITIPESVTSIGSEAFSGCYRLSKIICLSSIPPSCNGTSTFECSAKEVRDKYEIYNYATLHVPMGSKEAYSSAYEWRHFNNIKEDMESNGQVFYANLMVKQGTTGYIRQPIKVEEKYTFYIGSLGEYKVNAVTFNGVDVTDEVNNGYYTTPEIKGESVLSISYETASAVGSVTLNKVKVTGYDGEINISNIDEPSDVSIYSTDGKLIDNVSSAYGEAKIYVPSEQLYIVKVGTRTFKVAL